MTLFGPSRRFFNTHTILTLTENLRAISLRALWPRIGTVTAPRSVRESVGPEII